MVTFKSYVKLLFFLSSYVPLFLLLSIELRTVGPIWFDGIRVPFSAIAVEIPVSGITLFLVLFSIVLSLLLWGVVRYHSGHKTTNKRLDRYQQRNELLSTYLLVYIFAFAALDFTTTSGWAIFILFFMMLSAIQLNSEMLHINPILGIIGYRVYEVTSGDKTFLVVAGTRIEDNIRIPESEIDEKSPEYRNLEVIPMGQGTFIIPKE